jgi:hypothetical protein
MKVTKKIVPVPFVFFRAVLRFRAFRGEVSANATAAAFGFSPLQSPSLIATYPTPPALSVSKGLDRDRAVDQSGNQIAAFDRRGAPVQGRRSAPPLSAGRQGASARSWRTPPAD